MVRAKSREMEEAQDKTLALQRDDVSEEFRNLFYAVLSITCHHR